VCRKRDRGEPLEELIVEEKEYLLCRDNAGQLSLEEEKNNGPNNKKLNTNLEDTPWLRVK
jgi:hypothetical protein